MSAAVSNATEIEFGFTETPPRSFTDTDGQPKGSHLRLAKALFAKAHMPWHAVGYPGLRLFKNMQSGLTTFSILVQNPQVSECCIYSKEAVDFEDILVFWIGDKKPIKSLADFNGHRVIVTAGYSYGGLINYLDNPTNHIIQVPAVSHQSLFDMLIAGRADYLVEYAGPAEQTLAHHVPVPDLSKALLGSTPLYFVLSKKYPDAANVMTRLEATYKTLDKSIQLSSYPKEVVPALAAPLIIYYENRLPVMSRDGKDLIGIEGRIASEAFRAAKIEITLSEAPGARQIYAIENNLEAACAIGIYKTADRTRLGKFSQPLYVKPSKIVVARTDNARINAYTSMANLFANSSLSLVIRNGYSYGHQVDEMLSKAKIHVKRLPEDSHGRIKMVLDGSVDAALFTLPEADFQIKQFGDDGRQLFIMNFDDAPPPEPNYIYCSKSVDDSILDKLDDALKQRSASQLGH